MFIFFLNFYWIVRFFFIVKMLINSWINWIQSKIFFILRTVKTYHFAKKFVFGNSRIPGDEDSGWKAYRKRRLFYLKKKNKQNKLAVYIECKSCNKFICWSLALRTSPRAHSSIPKYNCIYKQYSIVYTSTHWTLLMFEM